MAAGGRKTKAKYSRCGPSGTPAPTRDRRECAGIRGCADAGRRGRRPLRGARPETWRDKCGRGVPIGGVQTRDAGAGGVFRRTVIDRCGPSGRRIQNYVGCKALPLHGAREESFRAVRRSGSGDRSAGDSVRNLFAPQLQLDEREIQKPSVFGGVLFHISFAVERNMAAGGIHAGRGCNPQSENRKRAVGDAGPYGVQPSKYAGIQRCTDAGTIMAQGTINVVRGSGSGDRSTSDSLRNLFVPQSQSDGRKSKDHRSLAAFLHPFADAGKRMSRRSAKYPFLWRKNERAVGDAGPYGVRDRRHGEISVGGVCPLGAFKRGTRERVAFSGGL